MPDSPDGNGLIAGDEFVDSTGMPRFDDAGPDVDPNALFDGFPQGEDAPTKESDAADMDAFRKSFGHLPQEALTPEEQELAQLFGEQKRSAEEPKKEEVVSSPEEQAKRSRALEALQRGGLKLDDFANTDTAIERGLALADRQAEVDAKFAERRAEKATERTSSTPGHTDAVAPGPTEDHTQTVAAIEAILSEQLGDDGKVVSEKISSLVRAGQHASEERIAAVYDWMEQSELRQARAADPRLKSDAAWNAVKEAYGRISDSSAYRGIDGLHQAVRDATMISLGAPKSSVARAESQQVENLKATGGLTNPNRDQSSNGKKSHLATEVDGFRNAFALSRAHNVATFGPAGEHM